MKYYLATFKESLDFATTIEVFHKAIKFNQEIQKPNQSLMLRLKHLLSYNANINDYNIYEIECDNKFNFISFNKIDNSVIKKLAMLL